MPGKLHEIFADEHALGKVLEGSGLDTITIESGVYSAAALRGIFDGKNYTRALEFHIMTAMAITSLKLEATFGSEYPTALKACTEFLRKALHIQSHLTCDIINKNILNLSFQTWDPIP